MKVAVAAGGRFHSIHLAHQLHKRSFLKKFFTTAYEKNDRELVPQNLVYKNSILQFGDKIFQKLRLQKIISSATWCNTKDDLFDSWLSKQINSNEEINVFVGWANYILNSMKKIKNTGAKIVLECGSMHIIHQDKLLREEYEKWGLKTEPVTERNKSKMLQEYEKSDYIAVPSSHVENSFLEEGFDRKKILKIPYGVDVNFFYKKWPAPQKKFIAIFAGLVSLQKGIPYLIKAWRSLNLQKNYSALWIVGNRQKDFDYVLPQLPVSDNVVFWGSVSQEKLSSLLQESSLFILPSIQEGLSMTIAQAMAAGLPVLCTENTGARELVTDGKDGFIVPIRDQESLQKKILWFYENRDEAFLMGQAGQKNIEKFTWDRYGEKIENTYRKIIA